MAGEATAQSTIHRRGVLVVLTTLVTTRLAVWGIAVAARLIWGRDQLVASYFDLGQLTQPFGWSTANLVSGVLSRWDGVWYLLISTNGYDDPRGLPSPDGPDQWGASVNFFPGWPILVRVASGFAASHVAVLIAAYVLALVAYGVGLTLLYRLTELEFGSEAAVWAVVLLAVFPGALFFGTPYAESLFFALSVGSLYAVRTGRWRSACLLAAGAALTRVPGILLVIPLALAWREGWVGRDRSPAWLLLVPAALLAFVGYAWALTADPLAYFHISHSFKRALYDPFTATFISIRAAFEHGRDLARLVAFAAATAVAVSAARRLPKPYVAYAAASLLVILCTGLRGHPLDLALRYLAPVFPVFMEAGRLAAQRRVLAVAGATVMGVGLAVVTAEFAHWWFVG